MLFDLQGKRRRVVQATYLVLAVLMGGGLVLFGIGGDVSGGLFDAFSGNGSGGNANQAVEERIERNEKALKANPRNQAALADLVRSHYQLATDDADPNTGAFGQQGRQELREAAQAWERYVEVAEKPDDSLAGLMLQAYGEGGLGQPEEAVRAAEIVADARPSAVAYLQLAQYAAQAGQTRKAELAGQKAIELAPKGQKKIVKQQVDALTAQGVVQPEG